MKDLDKKALIEVNGAKVLVEAKDLIMRENLGRGAYGTVDQMEHVPSGVSFAVKVITNIVLFKNT